jgi:hypothetical protein
VYSFGRVIGGNRRFYRIAYPVHHFSYVRSACWKNDASFHPIDRDLYVLNGFMLGIYFSAPSLTENHYLLYYMR